MYLALCIDMCAMSVIHSKTFVRWLCPSDIMNALCAWRARVSETIGRDQASGTHRSEGTLSRQKRFAEHVNEGCHLICHAHTLFKHTFALWTSILQCRLRVHLNTHDMLCNYEMPETHRGKNLQWREILCLLLQNADDVTIYLYI